MPKFQIQSFVRAVNFDTTKKAFSGAERGMKMNVYIGLKGTIHFLGVLSEGSMHGSDRS